MKVLCTGGAGFIGSNIVDAYIDHGYDVIVVDNLSTGKSTNINPRATFYKANIQSPEIFEIIKAEKPDFINHHAAQIDVRRSVIEPVFDANTNIIGSLNLLEAARNNNIKHFIYISSGGAVYGEPQYLPCDESHPVIPICPYGASKHTVEHYLNMYHLNYGLEYTVLRYSNVYGPRQDPFGEAGVVAIFAGRMLENKELTINGDGEQSRDFVHVKDCVEANLLALNIQHPSGIYNIGVEQPTTINEIFKKMSTITGYQNLPIYGPTKLGETRSIYLNSEKAHKELGWYPNINLDDGLNLTIEYFKRKK